MNIHTHLILKKTKTKYGYTFDKDDPTNWNNGTFTKSLPTSLQNIGEKNGKKK